MALYTIGEVALLCDINPVTLRAWQRRYGLLKPQRTDGGHRLFNDADIAGSARSNAGSTTACRSA
ncbi:MerR family DNA-binding transcriptional regulator, partial [Staphylococcus sp. GCP4]|nr:MerR family DNA-binding transcriptional regulator [Staphylococcus sp. GCP4]